MSDYAKTVEQHLRVVRLILTDIDARRHLWTRRLTYLQQPFWEVARVDDEVVACMRERDRLQQESVCGCASEAHVNASGALLDRAGKVLMRFETAFAKAEAAGRHQITSLLDQTAA